MNPAGKNCTVTRIGRLWDAILVTDDGFGALMCQQCAQSQIRLGEWGGGGGIPFGGGGGGGGVGEPRTGIIYEMFSLRQKRWKPSESSVRCHFQVRTAIGWQHRFCGETLRFRVRVPGLKQVFKADGVYQRS